MSILNAAQRRQSVLSLLTAEERPISATALAGAMGVSRQVIVGDVALLRAAGAQIIATPRGYLLSRAGEAQFVGTAACIHSQADMGQELRAIVDAGGEAVDVIVEHPVYGELTGALHIRSRYDVAEFLGKISAERARPLSDLTGGVHLHTIACPDEATFQRVLCALDQGGFLFKDTGKEPPR